jgi:hypothetical protein
VLRRTGKGQRKNPAGFWPEGFFEAMVRVQLAGALDEKGALADAVAEVMKFCAADFAFSGDFDLGDTWCVEWENTLDSLTVGNFTDSESGVDTGAAFCDYKTSENLDALLAAFDYPAMDFDRVAYVE